MIKESYFCPNCSTSITIDMTAIDILTCSVCEEERRWAGCVIDNKQQENEDNFALGYGHEQTLNVFNGIYHPELVEDEDEDEDE